MSPGKEREAFQRFLEEEIAAMEGLVKQFSDLPGTAFLAQRYRIQLVAFRIVLDELRKKRESHGACPKDVSL